MKVKFCGAVNEVTGSCTHLHYRATDTQFLVDCGMIQGGPHVEFENSRPFPFNPADLKFVLLTHAHLDHCGLIPRLYREGFKGQVFCTRATARIAKEVMQDSARITKGDLYQKQDVDRVRFYHIDARKFFKWGQWQQIDQDLNVFINRSAHILGSCSIGISWKVGVNETGRALIQSMLFSGDVGPSTEMVETSKILKDTMTPFPITNFLVLESTKGELKGASVETAEERLNQLGDLVKHEIFNEKRKLVVAAFSVHRMQEILYDLVLLAGGRFCNAFDSDPSIPVSCESGLGKSISGIYAEELFAKAPNGKNMYYPGDELDEVSQVFKTALKGRCKQGPFLFNSWKSQNKRAGYGKEPSIVISSSGMCEHGAIEAYLQKALFDESFTVLLTGYQATGTNGAQLMRLMNDPEYDGILSLGGERISTQKVKARIRFMSSYSGHAAPESLMNGWLGRLKPDANKAVFLNHGSATSCRAFKELIQSSENTVVSSRNVIVPEKKGAYLLSESGAGFVREEVADGMTEEVRNLCIQFCSEKQGEDVIDLPDDPACLIEMLYDRLRASV